MTAKLEVALEDIPGCFEGVIPVPICTVDEDGMPNVTYLSVVRRVDKSHVALSRQFFKKTDANTIVNPRAQVLLSEPSTGRQFFLDLVYERTETSGPLFETMRTNLDAVAAHEGMENVFRLKGVDVCRVEQVRPTPSDFQEKPPPRDVQIEKVQALSQRIAGADDLEDLLRCTLEACDELFGNGHAFVMLADESGEKLYTLESLGYPFSGAGSEVALGEGVIGIAAARRQTVRLTHMARELSYSHAVQDSARREAKTPREEVIPLPTLPTVQSQMVVPMLAYRKLVGVICLQSNEAGAFQACDEAAIGILANQVAMAIAAMRPSEPQPAPALAERTAPADADTIQVKHYSDDDSVFLDNEYLIKGVAGGIFWRLLQQYQDEGREEFSNRELRLDPTLDLPDIKDNLEARLILLRRRLEERCGSIRIERTGRGRFRLIVERPLKLLTAQGGGPL